MIKRTWFIFEANDDKVVVAQINPHRSDGVLKQFIVDGEGYLWMPYVNPVANAGTPAKPQRYGLLLAVVRGEPPPDLVVTLAAGRQVVVVPMS